MAEEEPVRPAKRPRVLVACQRCKTRRQKCDNSSPACSNCHRAGVSCVYGNHAYPSSYVKRLEDRVRQLEGHSAENNSIRQRFANERENSRSLNLEARSPAHSSSPGSTPSQSNVQEASTEQRHDRLALGMGVLSSCAVAEPHYFGFSAGLSLGHFVQVAISSAGNFSDVSLPLLADRPFSSEAPKADTTLADPPSYKTGMRYVHAYLALVQPLYPFLHRQRIWELHQSITKHSRDSVIPQLEKIDQTIVHLIYAIGSRCLQLLRKDDISDTVPEGHFLRAMENVNQHLKFTSMKSIEVTLLLAIYSMRSPYGTNVWHLSGLVIRQCLELGLHKQRIIDRGDLELDQYRKLLFWSAYIFERKTALVLGRPFALSDEDIDLDLPSAGEHGRTNLSYHMHHIKLYQLHTQIRLTLHRMNKNESREELRVRISDLLDQLDQWRQKVLEIFQEYPIASTCTQSRPTNITNSQQRLEGDLSVNDPRDIASCRPAEVERNELLLEYQKARRSLLQPLMTEGRHNYHFDTADYAACAEASGQICQLYRRLHRLSPVPFTLRDLHAVFVAGFTLIYCVCTCPNIYSLECVSDVGACSTVLYLITEQWSSARKYRDSFETIAEKMMDSVKKMHHDMASMQPNRYDYGASQRDSGDNIERNGALLTLDERHKEQRNFNNIAPVSSVEQVRYRAQIESDSKRYDAVPGLGFDETGAQQSLSSPRSSPSSSTQRAGAISTDTSSFNNVGNRGIGLDLDSDFSDIEKLLSSEGLDWFKGAVF